MTQEYLIISEAEMAEFARQFASNLKPNDVIAFEGTLGAGKSFLCRHLIQTIMRCPVTVISPTFNLLQIYDAPDFQIYHYDLYRLKNFEEIYELGIEDAFAGNVCLIEWPEIIELMLPKNTIRIKIEIISEFERKVLVV